MIRQLLSLLILSAFLAPFVSFPEKVEAVSNNGLIGYWAFNEGTSTQATDFSGKGNHGTLVGMENADWTTAGKRAGALNFDDDGTDERVFIQANTSLNLTGPMAACAWIYPDVFTSGSEDVIIGKGDLNGAAVQFSLNTETTANTTSKPVEIFWTDNAGSGFEAYVSNSNISVGQWYHICGVRTAAGEGVLYVNGVATTSTKTGEVAAATNNENIAIGRGADFDGVYWDGRIDEVRLYNRELVASEVAELYALGATLVKPPNNLGLVGYWAFNEGTSTQATDFSGRGSHGTLTTALAGLPEWTTGKLGGGISIESDDDVYVDMGNPSVLNITSAGTISAWIKLESFNQWGAIAGKFNWGNDTNGYGLTMDTESDVAAFFLGDASSAIAVGVGPLSLNTWYHLTGTWDGTTIRLYLNGVEVDSGLQGGLVPTPATSDFSVGRLFGSNSHMDGVIDEVRVYNRALGPTEVAALAQRGAVPTIASAETLTKGTTLGASGGLVGHWSFDGGDVNWTSATAGVVYDRSGTGANGTLTNMERGSDVVPGRLGQALNFDETNNFVSIADNAAHNFGTTEDFSVALWTKARPIAGVYAGLVGKKLSRATNRQGYLIAFNGSGISTYIDDGIDSATIISAGAINDGAWHHVVLTASRAGNATLYIDGAANGTPVSLSLIGDLDDAGVPVTIGDIGFEGQPFDGSIDDVRIYSRVLTASEILQLYRLGQATIVQ